MKHPDLNTLHESQLKADIVDNVRALSVAVLQPGFMPWLGFFDQMHNVDVFVLYDDVQFDKHGWRNRNRLKSPEGPQWLTVPVKVSLGQSILDVEIDNRQKWMRRHLASIRQLYSRAPYLSEYLPELEDVYSRHWQHIVDLDIELIELLRRWLGIETKVLRSSQLGIGGGKNQRLLNICQQFGASRYLSGAAAKSYLDIPLFEAQKVEVRFQDYDHPVYRQLHGDFVPYLSALDLVLNCGPGSLEIIAGTERH